MDQTEVPLTLLRGSLTNIPTENEPSSAFFAVNDIFFRLQSCEYFGHHLIRSSFLENINCLKAVIKELLTHVCYSQLFFCSVVKLCHVLEKQTEAAEHKQAG